MKDITDKLHIETALAAMQAKGKFTHLRLNVQSKTVHGKDGLVDKCQRLSESPQSATTICIADSDDADVVKRLGGPDGRVKDWGHNVFSIVLPTPAHRKDEQRLCIELLYQDADFFRTDANGRRLFRCSEFDPNSGIDVSRTFTWKNAKSGTKLLVDTSVFEFSSSESKLLSKADFAELIKRNRASVNFDGFEPLFHELLGIRTILSRR